MDCTDSCPTLSRIPQIRSYRDCRHGHGRPADETEMLQDLTNGLRSQFTDMKDQLAALKHHNNHLQKEPMNLQLGLKSRNLRPRISFQHLPCELRDMIWKLTGSYQTGHIFKVDGPVGIKVPRRLSQTMKTSQVCREARGSFLPTTRLAANGEMIATVWNAAIWEWFDLTIDSIFFTAKFSGIHDLEDLDQVVGGLKHAILHADMMEPAPRLFDELVRLTSLRDISFFTTTVREREASSGQWIGPTISMPFAVDLDDESAISQSCKELFWQPEAQVVRMFDICRQSFLGWGYNPDLDYFKWTLLEHAMPCYREWSPPNIKEGEEDPFNDNGDLACWNNAWVEEQLQKVPRLKRVVLFE